MSRSAVHDRYGLTIHNIKNSLKTLDQNQKFDLLTAMDVFVGKTQAAWRDGSVDTLSIGKKTSLLSALKCTLNISLS